MRHCLVVLVIVGCGNKADAPAPSAGSGSASGAAVASGAGSAPGSAAPTGSGSGVAVGSGSGSGSTAPTKAGSAATSGLELKPGEKLHTPASEIAWTPPAGKMKVTVVDVAGPPETARLVVWGDGHRHDVVNTKKPCIAGELSGLEHAAELTLGPKNTVLFRCESYGKTDIAADEWLVRWQDNKDFPTLYRHWRGPRFHRDPKWAGGKQRYPEQEVDDNDERECCCLWEDEGDEVPGRTSMRYCKGSTDHHGVCVADSKCKKDDE